MTFGKPEILGIFQKLDETLRHPVELCMIGSVPLICNGLPNRSTEDFDLWASKSKLTPEIIQATQQLGMLWNPKEQVIDTDQPYWQVIQSGLVQVGSFEKTQSLWKGKSLTVTSPPWENLIASKLVRSTPKDLEDIRWIAQTQVFDKNKVKEIISKFKNSKAIKENLIYLDIFTAQKIEP